MQILNILCALFFISKIYSHYYLAHQNSCEFSLRGMLNPDFFEYMWFYNKPVTAETEKLRRTVNLLYVGFLLTVLAIVFTSFVF